MSKSKKVVEANSATPVGEQRSVLARGPIPLSSFVETKEYSRFVQVCEASRHYGYIVMCIGERGVGKTWAAREYAQWDLIEPLLSPHGVTFSSGGPMPRTAFYRPRATPSPKNIEQDLALLFWSLQLIGDHERALAVEALPMLGPIRPDVVDVLIVDEVDGLTPPCLEALRYVFDGSHLGLVLLGRPGCERRVLNMPALASRVGVLHTFGTLGRADSRQLLEEQVRRLRVSIETEAAEMFVEKTGGNLQAMRIMLCHLDYMITRRSVSTVTVEVIEEAMARLSNRRNVERLRGNR